MFCWPSRRSGSNSSRKKAKSELSVAGDDADSIVTGGSSGFAGSGSILVKPHKSRKKGKKSTATFKCDLSEALLPPSDECLLSLRSASCNSSIRELSGYHQRSCSSSIAGGGGSSVLRGGSNKNFVSSSQHIPNFPVENTRHHLHHRNRRNQGDEDSDSVNNNNNRSADVLLFYSNNSLSTRNSVADFIENEEFNYKSLWGKDICEWDSRESRCNTLEREDRPKETKASYPNTIDNNNKTQVVNQQSVASTKDNCAKSNENTATSLSGNGPNQKERLSSAQSSPSLNVTSSTNYQRKSKPGSNISRGSRRIFDDDEGEPLPSPPPTPPEAKICLSVNSSIGNCSFFKYHQTPASTCTEEESREKCKEQNIPFPHIQIDSSTSTSSLSSSCVLSPEITEGSARTTAITKSICTATTSAEEKADSLLLTDCSTQTLPFWQLEFPGILHCSCSRSSEDSGISPNISSGGSQPEDCSVSSPSPVAVVVAPISGRGHESPGADSSSSGISGISGSDDNLESLQADEEIMLKSLKNSFLHQAIPFRLCNFNSESNNGESKSKNNTSGAPEKSVGQLNAKNVSKSSPSANECQKITNGVTSNVNNKDKKKAQEHNVKKQKLTSQIPVHQQRLKERKSELSTSESVSTATSVTNSQDRNRLGPVGKNYGSSGLDANANESEAPLHRGHGQTNGEVDVSGKSCTNKLAGSGEPLIDPASVDTNTTSRNLIIHKNKSTNNRVSSTNHHNIQNSVLVQENSSLKEEVGRLTSVVSDLQEQIGRLTAAGEETRQALEVCSKQSDTKCAALSIVVQQCDKERLGVYEQLVQQQAENEIWKQRLEEKLAELQKLQLEYEQEREQNQEEIRAITARHEVEVEITVRNCENKLEEMQKRHDETLVELKRSHTEELERLQESQKQELEQTIQKHRELLDQHRNQSPHDILHKEVESLQVVVEMRNEDIRVLRKDLMDYKNTLNDLQASREYGKSLLAKTEDLQAQLEKARADKRGLQENYQQLEMNLQQTEAEKDRLVRLNEELNWKMKHEYNLVEN